jgi:hypothetical protein
VRALAIFLRRESPRVAHESLLTRYHPRRVIQPAILLDLRNACGYAQRFAPIDETLVALVETCVRAPRRVQRRFAINAGGSSNDASKTVKISGHVADAPHGRGI